MVVNTMLKALSFILIISISLLAQGKTAWFVHDKNNNNYSIIGEDIRPSSFFYNLSLHSGIEIKYDTAIKDGMYLEFEEASLTDVLRHIENKFSTLKEYSKDSYGKEILISIAVLPKGKFSIENMIVAIDPIIEASMHKKGDISGRASNVYVTRMEKLEIKVRQQLEKLAQKNIDREEKLELKKQARINKREQDKKEAVAELKELKSKDQDAYAIRLKTLSWKYPDIEKSLAEN